MIDDKNTIAESASKAGIEDKKSLSGEKHFPDPKASPGEWIKANWLWMVAHILNLVYALNCFYQEEEEGLQIFPVVIFMCIIFVQLYTDPIKPLPPEGSDTDERNKIEEKRSQQRNKWMKFAYSFHFLVLKIALKIELKYRPHMMKVTISKHFVNDQLLYSLDAP